METVPLLTWAVPSEVPLSKICKQPSFTLPDGVTVTTNLTVCPTTDGFGVWPVIVAVVAGFAVNVGCGWDCVSGAGKIKRSAKIRVFRNKIEYLEVPQGVAHATIS